MFKIFQQYWWFPSTMIAFFIEPLIKFIWPTIPIALIRPLTVTCWFAVSFFLDWYTKKKYRESHDFDYKIFFRGKDTTDEPPMLCLPDSIKKMQLKAAHNNLVFFKNPEAVEEAEKLLAESAILSRPIYKKNQADHASAPELYILQCLFVPIDKNNNTLKIRRKKENHGSIFFRRGLGNVSFISFSPVPDHYNEEFSRDKAYYREVYEKNGVEKGSIQPYALCLRHNVNNNNYLFLIYTVKYENTVFSNDPEDNTIKKIFGTRNADGKMIKDSYFQKDHDVIQEVITFDELLNLPKEISYSQMFSNIKNALKDRKFKDIFKLKFDILMNVEKEIIKQLVLERPPKEDEEIS